MSFMNAMKILVAGIEDWLNLLQPKRPKLQIVPHKHSLSDYGIFKSFSVNFALLSLNFIQIIISV